MKGILKVELGGVEFDCEFSYSPGRPATMYRSNGDPGDPADPEEFELLSCRMVQPKEILGYQITWADGTKAVCSKKPEHQEECQIIPLVAVTTGPDFLDTFEDLGGLDQLYDMAQAEFERMTDDYFG